MATRINREAFRRQIEDDINWARDFYNQRNQDFGHYERWVQKKHYADLSEDVPVAVNITQQDSSDEEIEHLTTINIPTAIIEDAHTMLTNEDPLIEVLIRGKTTTSKDRASRIERFLSGCYYINSQVQGRDVVADAVFNMLVYGWGVLRAVWDVKLESYTVKEDEEEGTADYLPDHAFPIVVQSLHPKTVFPLPGGRFERWRGVFQEVYRMVGSIEEEWGKKVRAKAAIEEDGTPLLDPDTKEPLMEEIFDTTYVRYVDYWCWKGARIYHAVLANDSFLKPPTEMPEYESLPYEVFFCRNTSFPEGDKYSFPFLYTIIDSVKELETLANQTMRAIELYADPPLVALSDSETIEVEKSPGSIIEGNVGDQVFYLQWQGNPPDVPNMMNFWRSMIHEHGFPPVLSGAMGGTSGLDTVALQQGGLSKLFQSKRNTELAVQRINTKMLRMFQRQSPDKPLLVRGVRIEKNEEHPFSFSLKGSETRGFEYTKVTIRAKFPQEELRNAAIAQGLASSKLMSREDIMTRFLYQQDPQAVFEKMRREDAMNHPGWLDFLLQKLITGPSQTPIGQALAEEAPLEETREVEQALRALAAGGAGGGPAAGPAQVGPESARGLPPEADNVVTFLEGR